MVLVQASYLIKVISACIDFSENAAIFRLVGHFYKFLSQSATFASLLRSKYVRPFNTVFDDWANAKP